MLLGILKEALHPSFPQKENVPDSAALAPRVTQCGPPHPGQRLTRAVYVHVDGLLVALRLQEQKLRDRSQLSSLPLGDNGLGVRLGLSQRPAQSHQAAGFCPSHFERLPSKPGLESHPGF